MHELMVTCQELVKEDVDELVSGYTQPLPLPIGPPSAVAEPAKNSTISMLNVWPWPSNPTKKPSQRCAGRPNCVMIPMC